MKHPRLISGSGDKAGIYLKNPLICVSDVDIHLDFRNSGDSYMVANPEFGDPRVLYSYVFRRPEFVASMIEIDKSFPGVFYIDASVQQRRNRKLRPVRPVNPLNVLVEENHREVDRPSIDNLAFLDAPVTHTIYEREPGNPAKPYFPGNFEVTWSRLDDGMVQLELRILKTSQHHNQGVWRETYVHGMFDLNEGVCNHL
ncbi:hypothetical protein JW868_02995, partial [Candidatus Woesearchaeota archaeon]|nr:hypothetical protein [Candidatus Woesearchaeota archaeon]